MYDLLCVGQEQDRAGIFRALRARYGRVVDSRREADICLNVRWNDNDLACRCCGMYFLTRGNDAAGHNVA